MKIYEVTIQGAHNYSQSRHIDKQEVPALEKEGPDAYEERTWKHKMHSNQDGYVVIPRTAFKNCLSDVAKFLSIQIPGKGKSTYTKHFEAGIMVINDPAIAKLDDVKSERVYVPADGKRGGGKRVWRRFPFVPTGWRATFQVMVIDETITRDVLEKHIREAGLLIGLGRFRPRNNGYYGRFDLVSMSAGEEYGGAQAAE